MRNRKICVTPLIGSHASPIVFDARISALQLLQCLMVDLQMELFDYSSILFYTLSRQIVIMASGLSTSAMHSRVTHIQLFDVLGPTISKESLQTIMAACSSKQFLANVPPTLVQEIFNTINCFFKNCIDQDSASFKNNYPLLCINSLSFIQADPLHFKLFIAESFSVFVRKVKSSTVQSNIIKQLLQPLLDTNVANATNEKYSMEKGIALVLFECIKSVDHEFQSKAPILVNLILTVLFQIDDQQVDVQLIDCQQVDDKKDSHRVEQITLCHRVFEKLLIVMGHHATEKTVEPIIDTMISFAEMNLIPVPSSQICSAQMNLYLKALACLVGLRKASRISPTSAEKLTQSLSLLFQAHHELLSSKEFLYVLAIFSVYLSPLSMKSEVTMGEMLEKVTQVKNKDLALFYVSMDRMLENDKVKLSRGHLLKSRNGMKRLFENCRNSDPCSNASKEIIFMISNLPTNSILLHLFLESKGQREQVLIFIERDLAALFKNNQSLNQFLYATRLIDSLFRVYDSGVSGLLGIDIDKKMKKVATLTGDYIASLFFTGSENNVLERNAFFAFIIQKFSTTPFCSLVLSRFDSTLVFKKILESTDPSPLLYSAIEIILQNNQSLSRKIWDGGSEWNELCIRLRSSQSSLRKSMLGIFSTLCHHHSTESLPHSFFQKMIQICIEIEETPMDVMNQRQFPILLTNLQRTVLQSNQPEKEKDQDKLVEVSTFFLLGLYSCRFTPVFKLIGDTLEVVCREGKEHKNWVWKGFACTFQFLWRARECQSPREICSSFSLKESGVENNGEEVEEEEKETFSKRDKPLVSFQCSHIHQLETIQKEACGMFSGQSRLPDFENEWFDSGVDVDLWVCQLIEFLGKVPSLIIEKSEFLNQFFLQLIRDEDQEHGTMISKRKKKLAGFLSMFSKVSQPRKLFQSDQLYELFLGYLSNGDAKLQGSALECIKTWQYPLIQQYYPTLSTLAQDQSRVSDVVTSFDLDTFHSAMNKQEQDRVMQVFIRLLYGKLVTKHARTSHSIVKSRTIGVFGFLCRDGCESYRDMMVTLMVEPILKKANGDGIKISKQVIGFLNLVHDFIKILQRYCVKYLDFFLQVFLGVIRESEKVLRGVVDGGDGQGDVEGVDEEEDGGDDEEEGEENQEGEEVRYLLQRARTVRTLSLKRICLLFQIDLEFDFSSHVATLFKICLDGRIDKLAFENTQGPSVLLDLFLVWSRSTVHVSFLELHPHLFRQLLLVLSAKKVHESVVIRVLEIIENVQDVHDLVPHLEYLPRVLKNDLGLLLDQCKLVLSTSPIKLHSPESIPNRIIRILSRISVFIEESHTASSLLEILVPFLKSSSKAVPESSKVEILRILAGYYPTLDGIQEIDPCTTSYYSISCQLFSTLETVAARTELLRVFDVFVRFNKGLETVVGHLHDLNAMSTKRIDEVDFNRRFSAYSQINQSDYKILTLSQWKPLLFNHIYQVGDFVEYSVRTSAAFGLLRYIEIAKEKRESGDDDFFSLIQHIIFPHVKKGLKVSEKLVRYEWIKVWGNLVDSFSTHSMFSDLVCLRGVDEETNFFANITHIQMHRRLKAVRMLSSLTTSIKPSNITHLISILTHFIYGTGEGDHNLMNETMSCIASCCSVLSWGQYYNLIKRFMNSIKFRPELEKILVRLIVLVLDEFHYTSDASFINVSSIAADQSDDVVPDVEGNEEEEVEEVEKEHQVQNEKIQTAVTSKLIPSLQKLLAVRDDETLAVRTPLAIAIVKLLKQLPVVIMHAHLPKVLLTLCNFLSSHLQSSRDSARATLVTISKMLGAKYLSYIIKGLTTALTRGYQLHVLGYTLHSIIVENASCYTPGSIDSCVEPIVKICMQDIFGETGKEREVQELKGKMREIKSTKSFETFEYLCKVISFHQIKVVLKPIKEQMLETNDIKVVKHIENVFRRLAVGINGNESIDVVHFMVFVQQLLSESLPLTQVDNLKKTVLSESEKRVQVMMKRTDASVTLKYYEANVHMFVEFGLSLLLTSLKREKISVKIPEHLCMLDPLVPLIGRALYGRHASIIVLALRVLCIIIKLPLPELDDSIVVIVKRSFQLIAKTGSTDSELIQAVFKLLVIIFRDCKHVSIPERQIVTLLALLTPDLEDPEKETTTFSLIRSILERKYITNEVYDIMDVISRILVTSQSNHVRELCRGCYIHFLINYPHGHARLRKQIAYLVSNLEYEFESGRCSVLELFHLAISKFSEEIFKEYSDMLFLSIVLILGNDDSPKCREMSGLLIKELCLRLGVNRMGKPLLLLNKWFDQSDTNLHRVSCQLIGLIVDAFENQSKPWISGFLQKIIVSMQNCYNDWKSTQDEYNELDQELALWELGYFSLKSLTKIIKNFPNHAILDNSILWQIVSDLLLHPHSWVRGICSQLMSSLFLHIDPSTRLLTGSITRDASSKDILKNPYSILSREADLKILAKKFTNQLDSDHVTLDMAKLVIKNLLFLSKCMIPFLSTSSSNLQVVQEEEPSDDEVGETEDVQKSSKKSLLWLAKRMCFLARADGSKNRGNILRVSVFQWFAIVYKHIPNEHRLEYLKMMVLTLYLVERDDTKKGEEADSLKQLATEVLSLLQKETGTTDYVTVYQEVHERIMQNRREKRTNRAIRAVSDPKAHALDRIKKTTAKINARKRKSHEFSQKRIKTSHSMKLGRKTFA